LTNQKAYDIIST